MFQAFGPKGVLTAQNDNPYPLTLQVKDGSQQAPIYHSFPSRYQQAYINELDYFCDIVQGKISVIYNQKLIEYSKWSSYILFNFFLSV